MTGSTPLPLVIWLSPAFPVGAFAYSHGLEWAFETGEVNDRSTLESWFATLIEHGSLHTDLILFASIHRAACARNAAAVTDIIALGNALQPSAERYLEATQQGNAFIAAIRLSWPSPDLERLLADHDGDIAYPLAVALACAAHTICAEEAMPAYALAFVANLTSAAVRLGIVGQSDGQRLIASLLPMLTAKAAALRDATLDDLGASAFRADLASLHHETQYSRLFRS